MGANEEQIQHELSVDEINARIKREICNITIDKLSDTALLDDYSECKSVKQQIQFLESILEKYINDEIKQNIIHEYLPKLIPPGTKGVIRGNKFNKIVKKYITKLKLDENRFEVCFEKQCAGHIAAEIPDWYILEKHTNKVIIGMNQLDLWGGGQQHNRGSKYISDNKHNTENSKLLCVVCSDIQIKGQKNKTYKLFNIGFKNNTLCYLNNLHNIITLYFG